MLPILQNLDHIKNNILCINFDVQTPIEMVLAASFFAGKAFALTEVNAYADIGIGIPEPFTAGL